MDYTLKQTRNKTIKNSYFDALKLLRQKNPYVSTEDVISKLIDMEAPRFYISFDNAQRIVSRMRRGLSVKVSNERKMEMYREIYRRFEEIASQSKSCNYQVLEKILSTTAPSFYVDKTTMRGIVYKTLKLH